MLGEAPMPDRPVYVTVLLPMATTTYLIKHQNVLPEQEVAGMGEWARACRSCCPSHVRHTRDPERPEDPS
jgi:hypothetical protein